MGRRQKNTLGSLSKQARSAVLQLVALSRLTQAKRLLHELGWLTACLYLLDRLLRRVWPSSGVYYYRFMAQPLQEAPRLPAGRGRAFSFELLRSPHPALSALGRPPAIIAQRFSQGAQCLLATRSGPLAGCIWFVRDRYLEDEVRVDYLLPQDGSCVWDFDVFVTEPERLGFLFAKQWDAFDALLRPQGIHHSISRINAFNQRSIASHRTLGAQDCGWAAFLCLGAVQCMLSSHYPFIALGGRPVLRIAPRKPCHSVSAATSER